MKEQWIKIAKAVGICVVICLVIATFVALLMRTKLLKDMTAYMYRLLALEVICVVILLIIGIAVVYKRKHIFGMDLFSTVMCVGISALFMAFFFCMVPTTIDRAYSVYILSDMTDNEDNVYSAQDIKERFIEGFIEKADGSKRRIEEQLSIGNIEEADGGYRISEKGKRLIKTFRIIDMIFPVADESSIYPNGH